MSIAALIVSVIALSLGTFTLLLNLGIIKIVTKRNDAYSKYRNEDGLYSAKSIKRNKGEE